MHITTLFEIYEPERNAFISYHKFYVEQAQKRLLAQFDDLDTEIDKFAQEYYDKSGAFFNPDHDDPSDFAERALEEANDYGMMLSEMRDQTLFSIVAGMYHQWDKHLREWMVKESRFWAGKNVAFKIWDRNFETLMELFEILGWPVKDELFYEKLEACQLIVNVYKHGNGRSLKDLRAKYPEYFHDYRNIRFNSDSWFDHTSIYLKDQDFEVFSKSILEFWEKLPKRFLDSDQLIPPKWLTSALLADSEASKTK